VPLLSVMLALYRVSVSLNFVAIRG